jgi:hypothetical protein
MKKSMKFALLALIAAGVLALIFIASGWLWSLLNPGKIEVPEAAKLLPADQVILGDCAKLSFEIVIPENLVPGNVEIVCGKGSAATGVPRWERINWRWSTGRWRFSVNIRALSAGEIPEGRVIFDLLPFIGNAAAKKYTVAIPEFSSVIPQNEKSGSELQLAGIIDIPEESPVLKHIRHYKYVIFAALLLLSVLLWFFIFHWRRRKLAVEIDCWDAALAALSSLHDQIRRGDILPEAAYTELMDILRNYLELRFDLPFSRRTTAEFLPELISVGSPLPEKFRSPLGAFLTNADMIRFAKAPATPEKLYEAVEQLAGMVRATIPETENSTSTSQKMEHRNV